MQPFKNEPLTDFKVPANKEAFEKALKKIKDSYGREIPLYINGEKITTDQKIKSVNPASTGEVVAYVSKASKEHADKAIRSAYDAFQTWRFVNYKERADYLFKAAKLMRERKHEFSACMVHEVGKNWVEADADTAEAIDFLDYYAHEMLRYGGEHKNVEYPGEDNVTVYMPLGVSVVIPPWNFPCAIMSGMTVASIVTGNTVVLKPSSDSPIVAYMLVELFEELGLPKGVLNYCPGSGSEIGDFIVDHPKTRMICFTGSKEVGLRIVERAAINQPGQIWIKRVIAEMGGKDAILVDKDADLDAAAEGIVISAFGFQGQKCSACSRTIIHQDIYDKLLDKIVERAKKIKVGNTTDQDNYMGPVCSLQAFKSIKKYIEIGKNEGKVVHGGEVKEDQEGYFIPPTIIADVDPKAVIAREEIFGPVLSVLKAKDFDHALEIANSTEYGLTGAAYTGNIESARKADEKFFVGNMYINRKCTGALVGVQPFGGFNMSGTDSKAGGPDYLLLFLQAKAISRKLGLSPYKK